MAENKYAGTQTEKNLQEAFAGESQARNKYTYFASVAKKEGYEQMSALFLKTADNEKEHPTNNTTIMQNKRLASSDQHNAYVPPLQ